MLTPSTRTARRLKQAISRRVPKRRDDSGLTTLEWLLIVAAVAGLAALAVVLVQNVVGSTGEQIEGQGARRTAAIFAAQSVIDDANDTTQPPSADTWADWEEYYTNKCQRLELTYGDANITVTYLISASVTDTAADVDATIINSVATLDYAADADELVPGVGATGALTQSNSVVAHCLIQ